MLLFLTKVIDKNIISYIIDIVKGVIQTNILTILKNISKITSKNEGVLPSVKFKGGKLNMKNYVIVFDQLYGKEIKLNMAMVSISDIRNMNHNRFTIVRYVSE